MTTDEVRLACCADLPLLIAAGASVGLAAALGGLTIAGLTLAVVVALLILRARRRRARVPRVTAQAGTRLESHQ